MDVRGLQVLQDRKVQEESGAPKENLVLAVLRELMESQAFLVSLAPQGLPDTHPIQAPMA